MSPVLTALLGVMMLPLFIGTWRASLFGLGWQGVLMALIAYRLTPNPHALSEWLTLADLLLVRGLLAPLLFFAVLRARNAPPRNDVIPPNMLSWTLALSIVLLSFTFAEHLVGEAGDQRTLVAVASTGLLLGFLVFSTQSGLFSQIVGALRIENAIALFELGGKRHETSLGVQLALLGIFLATLAFFRWYLATLGPTGVIPSGDDSGPEATI